MRQRSPNENWGSFTMVWNIDLIHLSLCWTVVPFPTMMPLYLKTPRVKPPVRGIPVEITHAEGAAHHRGEQYGLSLHAGF